MIHLISGYCLQHKDIPFSVPHYNSFVDINGDCKADLIITSESPNGTFLEFWLNDDGSTYCQIQSIEIPSNITLKGIAFNDIGSYFE